MDIHNTRTLIVGAGAVGGIIAARLHEKGADVTLLTRPQRFEQIIVHGLRLASPYGRFRKPVPAIISSQIERPWDLIVLACRAHRMDEAITMAAKAIGPETVVVSLLDGGPHLAHLQRRLPNNPVLEGYFEGRVQLDIEGFVSHRAPEARITIGERQPDDGLPAQVAGLLSGRGLVGSAAPDLPRLAWARSIFLAAGVGTSVLTSRPLRDALRFYPGQSNFEHMMAEGRKIAAAAGVQVNKAQTWRYRHALYLEAEPVMAPPRVTAPGGGGQEAAYLLAQMIERADGVQAPTLRAAFKALARDAGSEVADVA